MKLLLLLAEPEVVREVVVPLHWMAVVLLYLATSAVTKADSNFIREVRLGSVPPHVPRPPSWIGFLYYLQWGLLTALAVFEWKFAIIVFLFKSVLSFLGLLEIVGSVLIIPFLRKRNGS